eukprot:TRINITY_DN1352_c0_g1_i3.p1 TRINITY_DN1352_c0_g1~~TRINITY_DN1352_c0_g1_i3.p1  ORF type:complete len:998 (+),score=358.39 TRINITY_DN1352_c0_g1_i3:113-2995(+)
MADVIVKSKTFFARLGALYQHWMDGGEGWGDKSAFAVFHDSTVDDVGSKAGYVQIWLLGWEFPDTLMVGTRTDLYFLTSSRKAKILEPLLEEQKARSDRKPCEPTLHLLRRSKGSGEDDSVNCRTLLQHVKDSLPEGIDTPLLGDIPQAEMKGKLAAAWTAALDESGVATEDVTLPFAWCMAMKDTSELKLVRTAASISSTVLRKHLVPDMEEVIDKEVPTTHADLAARVDALFADPQKISPKLVKGVVDRCYTPIIQSGGEYDLRPSAESNDKNLHFGGAIICAIGAQYRSYSSNVCRTFFINPSSSHQVAYNLLLGVHATCLEAMKPGKKLGDVMRAAKAHIEKENPALLPNFVRNCGFSLGIGYREGKFVLTEKNNREIRAGMVFNLCIGFNNLVAEEAPDGSKARVFAVMVADTVIVGESKAEVITKNAMDAESVSYILEDKVAKSRPVKSQIIAEQAEKMTKSRLRERDADLAKQSAEEKLRDHQKALAAKIQLENLRKYQGSVESSTQDETATTPADIMTYASTTNFPNDIRSVYSIHIDPEHEAVLLPIYGKLVPFHIKTIKNVTKADNCLRINFLYPGSHANGPISFTNEELAQTFVRELTYQFGDPTALNNIYRLIGELKKRVTAREKEAQEKKSLVRQERLIVDRTARVPKLSNVFIRPHITGRGRAPGNLEAHRNGLRFSAKGQQVDILYKNVKHGVFQQAKKEVLVVLHFHLHDAIMVGKKKTVDVQVYAEVMEGSERLDNVKKRWGDVDEIEDEQRQRRLLNKLNENFNRFAQSVEHITDGELEFDIPFRELGFTGVHHRANVFLQPTVHCLVQLIEVPFFLVTLSDIAIVSLERVQFRLRNFDMVLVFKDFDRAPATIMQIPVEHLDRMKQWLNSCNIKFYQGPSNMQWNRIMKTIREDPADFFQGGGWSFLEAPSDEEEEEDIDDEEFEEDSEFEADDDDEDEVR